MKTYNSACFAILSTMGEWLEVRIIKNEWVIPRGFVFKGMVWGVFGVMITLLFTVFYAGVTSAQATGRLPFDGSNIASAFLAILLGVLIACSKKTNKKVDSSTSKTIVS